MGWTSELERQDWTYMSTYPSDDWTDVHWGRFRNFVYHVAKAMVGRQNAYDVAHDVIREKMLESKFKWWADSTCSHGEPLVFMAYVRKTIKNFINSKIYRVEQRRRDHLIKQGITAIDSLEANQDFETTGRRLEPSDPYPLGSPAHVAVQSGQIDYVSEVANPILAEFLSSLNGKADANMVTFEALRDHTLADTARPAKLDLRAEGLSNFLGILCTNLPPGTFINYYAESCPELKKSKGAARQRLTRLKEKFKPYRERLQNLLYVGIR